MGKRRERRMAAMSSAGRRVKLDLFAEPSGDLGGSSAQDELEGALNSKRSDGLPDSPSSSGQQLENPLMLLGQYSDDDEDNQSTKSHDHASGDTSLGNHANQVSACLVNGSTDLDASAGADQPQKVEKDVVQDSSFLKDSQKVDGSDIKDDEKITSSDIGKELDAGKQNHVSGTSDAQVVGDASSGWKMVLHEESNRYYYWNVETGETSWEVPEILAQPAEGSSDAIYAAATGGEKMAGLPLDSHGLNSISTFIVGAEVDAGLRDDGSASAHLVSQSKNLGDYGAQVDGQIEGPDSNQPRDLPWDENVSQQSVVGMHDSAVSGKCESGIDHWSRLIKLSESLLWRLNSLASVGLPHDQNWISKCVLEVEIRLSDMKSLSFHGSSLHPFWVHSEGELRRLESLINSKVGQLDNPALNDDTKETKHSFAMEDSGSHRSVKDEAKVDHMRNEAPSTEPTHSSPGVDAGTADAVHCEDVPPLPNVSNAYSGEDTDMDVDMEVDDASTEDRTIMVEKSGGDFAISDNLAEQETVVPDDGSPIPPPPDEEWIPPPPPDSEHIPPPPPPDEPEPSYPLPPSAVVEQPLHYTEQYILSYPNSNYEVYGHPQVSSSNYYVHPEAQVGLPQGTVPYGAAILNTYADTALAANNMDPVAYYNIQDGTASSTGIDAVVSTQFQIQSAPLSYSSSLTSAQVGASHSNLYSHPSIDPLDARGKTGNGFCDVTSTSAPTSSATVEAPATTSVRDGISEPSVNTTAASASASMTTSADAKVQPKALRIKKRTVASAPSLRSNKKVSSLVDKWKAAKEELEEEEEDEAKTALTMLEKKRQREIEEWRAQQIASGEARENANFQPLGGDWRERVKRKRAQANKEAMSTTEEPPKGNQQPDLADHSKDLPTGWQAYWDESSKQVYYGNTLTSETTWIRPMK